MGDYPKFYRLYEHSQFHTVIMLPNLAAELDVVRMMNAANTECKHKGELDDCIHIERTSIEEWLAVHPGD
jgi:hypothetical protein